MIILTRGSLTKAGRFEPESLSLSMGERGSTATLTMAIGTASITVGDWLQDDTEPGNGVVWRVKTVDTQYNTKTVTVQLEDMINSLSDQLLNGEVKPSDIAGSGATTCTAQQAIEYILSKQSTWALGSFDYGSVSKPYNFNGDSLKAAIETISGSLTAPVWSYDFSSYPFRLNITQESSAVDSEMRLSRNISTLKVSVDRSRMFTRFYPIGKNNLRLSSPGYVERNVSTWGVIEKTETDEAYSTTGELTDWANERLDVHAEPLVTVTISGLDLSASTGCDIDKFTIGKKCRVPLPEYNTTITEKVTRLNWRDKIHEPENVTVTLANTKEDIASIVNKIAKSSASNRRRKAKQGEDDHAWYVDTNDHVSMIAEAVAGKDGDQPNWSRVAQLTVDGNGIDERVTEAEGAIITNTAAIEMTASSIQLSVSAAKSEIYSSVEQTASGIHTEIVSAQSGLYAYVDQTASYFRQVYISETNHVWIQDSDPRGGGASPKEGDVWIESTSQGTWDGAEGFDWEHDEDYDWLQVQGAKIWGWKNNKWELVSDQQQVVTMTDVEQTSEHIVQRAIRVLVNDDGNLSVYRAELLVEGDRIRSEVYEAMSGMGSSIEQTASSIRSEVHAAQSELYSFILQTASQITIRVGESNMVFSGMTKPEGTEEHPLVDGDLWLESTFQRTWADMEELDAWVDDEDYDWSDLKGSKIHVYDAVLGDFKEVIDEQVLAQDTDIDETAEKISLVARSVKQVDGKVDVFRSELSVKADRIQSTLTQRIADVGSSITQTASQIRAEVHASQSQIYSSITQTASAIRSEVVDSLNDVNTSITQTASAIRAEVNASSSAIYSSITQTASAIRSEVASSVSGLQSSITQQANRISLVVEGTGSNAAIKPAAIVASINNSGSSVLISAGKILLSGTTKINDVLTVGSNHINITQPTRIQGDVMAETLTLRYGSSSSVISEADLAGMIKNASVSGNVLTLTTVSGSTINFSKATSLSAEWNGNRKFTVSASPQGNSRYTEIRSNVPNAKASWSNSVGTLTLEATIDGGETFVDVGTVTVNAPTDQGNNAGNVSLGSAEATTTRPTGTELASWRSIINSAITGRKYFRFRATLTNGTGSKWYYINFE